MIAADATVGTRDVTLTNPGGGAGALAKAFTVMTPQQVATLSLVYNGKLRDRVGQGDTALAPDGAADGTMTLTFSASGGKTITALQLSNGINGSWDTTAPNAAWVLGVASSLDGALLNNPSTMAINTTLPDGGSVTLFASDYNGGQGFAAGLSSMTPNQGTRGATVPVTINGSGFASGATVSAGAGITVSNIAFVSASQLTATFAIDSAAALGPRNVA